MFCRILDVSVVLALLGGLLAKTAASSSVDEFPLLSASNRAANTFQNEDAEYYVYGFESSWRECFEACSLLDYDNLLWMNSEDEWNYITVMLERFGIGRQYWIDGEYDGVSRMWRWHDGTPLPNWAPWEDREDSILNRVVIKHFNRFNATWLTLRDNEHHRCICKKVHLPTVPVPCYETNDLVLVLDSSGSITAPNYDIAKDFVARLALAYMEHSENRIGFVIFSDTATRIFDLQNGYTAAQMNSTIWGAPYMNAGTNTADGITMADNFLASNPRGFPQNMVILTDGMSNDPIATKAAADFSISHGIRTFSVGITNSVNQQELLDIAGGVDDAVFYTDDFDQLLSLLRPISIRICQ